MKAGAFCFMESAIRCRSEASPKSIDSSTDRAFIDRRGSIDPLGSAGGTGFVKTSWEIRMRRTTFFDEDESDARLSIFKNLPVRASRGRPLQQGGTGWMEGLRGKA
jgi:hypothetical protein